MTFYLTCSQIHRLLLSHVKLHVGTVYIRVFCRAQIFFAAAISLMELCVAAATVKCMF